MIETIITLSMLGYLMAATVMDKHEGIGYALTFPLRILFPIMLYHNVGTVDAVALGLGFSFVLSFEHRHFWKLGLLLILSYGQWNTIV